MPTWEGVPLSGSLTKGPAPSPPARPPGPAEEQLLVAPPRSQLGKAAPASRATEPPATRRRRPLLLLCFALHKPPGAGRPRHFFSPPVAGLRPAGEACGSLLARTCLRRGVETRRDRCRAGEDSLDWNRPPAGRSMGIHLLAFVAARGFLQVFQVSAPLLWPLNLWLPLARHLPEACAAFYGALVSHGARLRATVRRQRRDGARRRALDEYLSSAMMLTLSD